jgi:hypothetical protein
MEEERVLDGDGHFIFDSRRWRELGGPRPFVPYPGVVGTAGGVGGRRWREAGGPGPGAPLRGWWGHVFRLGG